MTRNLSPAIKKFFWKTTISFLFINTLFAIKIDKQKIDFGTIRQGMIVETDVKIQNDLVPVLNLGIRTSCDCVVVHPQKIQLTKGQVAIVKIKLLTREYSGKIEKKIFVQSNDPQKPYITIDILSNIFPATTDVKNSSTINENINFNKNFFVLPVTIFSSKGCKFCIQLKTEIVPEYEKKFGIKIEIEEYFVDEPQNYELLLKLEQQFNKQLSDIPVLFIERDVLGGKKEIKSKLLEIIQKYVQIGKCEKILLPKISQKEVNIKQLKLLPVIVAGFVDSVNPCAFATVIFLITYISMMLKKKKNEILLIGTTFIFGVFTTYFLIGIGIFNFVYQIKQISALSKIMYVAVGLFTLYASYEHFIEALKIKNGVGIADDTIKMKLPNKIRWKIYDVITKFSKLKYLIPTAFLLAVVITLLELFCTGQIYLPTIMYLVSIPQYKTTAVLYLLLYSGIFVFPLIIVFLLISFGMNLDDLKLYFQEKIYVIKFIMSGFFLFLAVSIFAFVFLYK